MELSKTKSALLATLGSKKMREKHGLFLAEGEKCALDTIGAFDLAYLVATSEWLDKNACINGVDKEKIFITSPEVMKKITTLATAPQVIAVFHLPEKSETITSLPKDELSLLLDGIQDPGNLGTIIRTADWFGFTHIYASLDTVDVFNPKTVQSTMGSLKRVKVVYTDLVTLIKNSGIENVYGTLLDGQDMFKARLDRKGAIIMGNEGKGLSEEIRNLVTKPLLIPPYNPACHAESLNVAIATAITLAQFRNSSN